MLKEVITFNVTEVISAIILPDGRAIEEHQWSDKPNENKKYGCGIQRCMVSEDQIRADFNGRRGCKKIR